MVIACFIAATGGMLFGYDLGVTGQFATGLAVVHLSSVQTQKIFIASLFLHPSLLYTGGVSSFPSFLNRFFPEVLAGKGKNAYCTYNSQKLQIFTSSYFLAGTAFCCCSSIMVMTQPVSQLCRNAVLCSCACGVFAGFCISCCFNHRQIMPACCSFALADPKTSFKP